MANNILRVFWRLASLLLGHRLQGICSLVAPRQAPKSFAICYSLFRRKVPEILYDPLGYKHAAPNGARRFRLRQTSARRGIGPPPHVGGYGAGRSYVQSPRSKVFYANFANGRELQKGLGRGMNVKGMGTGRLRTEGETADRRERTK